MSPTIPFNKIGEISQQKPYFPFPVALDRGLIEHDASRLPELVRPPGVDILSGRIPNNTYGGLVSMGSGKLAAFDHIAAEFHDNMELHIAPAHKDSVSDAGDMEDEGVVVVETDDGRVKVAAFVVDVTKRFWFIERMRSEGRCHILGELAVIPASIFDIPEFEIKDINSETGVIVASPRQPVY